VNYTFITTIDLYSIINVACLLIISMIFFFLEKIDVEDVLFTTNIATLQDLAVKYGLFKSFLSLPYLLRYVNRHHNVTLSQQSRDMKPLSLPLALNDAVVVKNG